MITVLVAFLIFYYITRGQSVERYMDTCYTYAMRDLDPTRSTKKIPGGTGNYDNTCNDMIQSIQEDYPEKNVYPSSHCPSDYYKVAPFIDPSQDHYEFHFYRQEQNGSWTHKMGAEGYPTNVDANGHVITNPSIADRDYGNLNYTMECPTLCVKK